MSPLCLYPIVSGKSPGDRTLPKTGDPIPPDVMVLLARPQPQAECHLARTYHECKSD